MFIGTFFDDEFDTECSLLSPRQLLELESPLSQNELQAVPTKDDVTALITFMGNWVANRQKFVNASKTLGESHFTVRLSMVL